MHHLQVPPHGAIPLIRVNEWIWEAVVFGGVHDFGGAREVHIGSGGVRTGAVRVGGVEDLFESI